MAEMYAKTICKLFLICILVGVIESISLSFPSEESPSEGFIVEKESKEISSPPIFPRRTIRSLKDVNFELDTAEGRHKNNRQSYNYKSKPRRNQYNSHNRHSTNKRGKGGYHASDSYDSNSGYSTNSNFDKATKGDYGDSDHKEYGGKSGNNSKGGRHGGREYGGSSGGSGGTHGGSNTRYQGGSGHHGDYGDDGNSYLSAGNGY
ncbi:unnamed protein product [Orchesella dallaii]|uniref:Uncharacterized protein n=1 Tax=Orchesella dallaii TaxID=48710 RepID=A0ABP1RCX3_9HEXA